MNRILTTRFLRRRILVLAALPWVLAATAAGAQAFVDTPPAIPREFRGAWVASVANIDWPSRPGLSSWAQQAELVAMLDRAVALNLNAIVLQVRPAADAFYASQYEPWSEYLTGVQGKAPEPLYDPLAFAVEQAHARGLELHAWFNPYRTKHPSATSVPAHTHISVRRPDLAKVYGRYGWMDPGEPEVMERTLAVILDVVQRYDVDGIHVDDYFYPYPETVDGVELDFPDSASYGRYRARGGTLAREDWRRHNVDTLMLEIYRRTKAAKPWVKVGISPFGIWRPGHPESIEGFDAYAKLYADARKWLREGWVDYFTPQLYWPIAQTAQSYATLLDWWAGENVQSRHLWPGHNANRAAGGTWPATELLDQIRLSRQRGAGGAIHFSMRSLMPPRDVPRDSVLVGVATQPPRMELATAMTERLRTELYETPALVPATPWLARGGPGRPVATIMQDSATGEHQLRLSPGDGNDVRWWAVRALVGDAWSVRVLPGAQRRLIVAAAESGGPTRMLVSAIDRYGTEGEVVEVP